jgi:hypothetical protein
MINLKFKMSLRGYNRLKLIKANKVILIELSCNSHRCNEFSNLLFQEKQNDKFKKLSVMWSLKRYYTCCIVHFEDSSTNFHFLSIKSRLFLDQFNISFKYYSMKSPENGRYTMCNIDPSFSHITIIIYSYIDSSTTKTDPTRKTFQIWLENSLTNPIKCSIEV